MYYSSKYNFLFIAIPKTGSSSVENALHSIDPAGKMHSITFRGKLFKGEDFPKGQLGHARAKEFIKILGIEFWNSLNTFAFVRHPLSKLVSAYYFSRQNDVWDFQNFKGNKNLFFRKASYIFGVLLAKALPFPIWIFIYPYRSNMGYIFNEKGKRLITYVGRTENLNEDLKVILENLGVNTSTLELKHINKSSHGSYKNYESNFLVRCALNMKCTADLIVYEKLSAEIDQLLKKQIMKGG